MLLDMLLALMVFSFIGCLLLVGLTWATYHDDATVNILSTAITVLSLCELLMLTAMMKGGYI